MKQSKKKIEIDDVDNTNVEKFDFGVQFQRLIIKLSIEVEDWYENNKYLITPDYFEFTELIHISSIISTFFDEHETVTSYDLLSEIIKKSHDKNVSYMILEELDEIENMKYSSSELQYVTQKLKHFSTTQQYKKSVTLVADAIDRGSIDEIPKIYDETLSFSDKGKKLEDVMYFDSKNDKDRYNSNKEKELKIPTLIKSIDDRLRGGLSKKELGMLLAPPNRGKSAALIQLGTNALFTGKNVLHVTLEMSKESVLNRYDCCLTGMTYNEIKKNFKLFEKKKEEFKRLYKGRLAVVEFPARSVGVNDLRVLIKSLSRRYSFVTDELILDYIDELKRGNREAVTYAVGENVADLRGLTSEMFIATWTASQTNRAGLSKVNLNMDDVGDSWDKAKVSDVIIAQCATEAEENEERQRWIMIKNRNNRKNLKPVNLRFNSDLMRFKEI